MAPLTRAEQSGFQETSRYEDVRTFITELTALTPHARVEMFGKSEEGRDRNQQGHSGPKDLEAIAKPDHGGGDDDRCNGEVGKLGTGAGNSESDVGLIANMQKEQRAHGGEEHRTESKVARESGLVQGKSSA